MSLSDEFYLREIVKLLAGPDGEGADALETIYRAIQAASGGGGGGGGGGGSFGPDTSIQMTVQNKSGDTLVKGSSVALTWVETGAHPAVIDFRDSDPDGRDHVLGVLAETIADNAVGLCTVRGPLTGIDTSGFSLGAVIYAGSPAGPSGWVAGFPASPYSHQLGVITVVDATVGEIYVLPEEASVPDHGHTGPGDGGRGVVFRKVGPVHITWDQAEIGGAGISVTPLAAGEIVSTVLVVPTVDWDAEAGLTVLQAQLDIVAANNTRRSFAAFDLLNTTSASASVSRSAPTLASESPSRDGVKPGYVTADGGALIVTVAADAGLALTAGEADIIALLIEP